MALKRVVFLGGGSYGASNFTKLKYQTGATFADRPTSGNVVGDKFLDLATNVEWIAQGTGDNWWPTQPVMKVKSAIQTLNGTALDSSVLQNDTHLVWPILASEYWEFDLRIEVTGASVNADFKLGWTLPTSATMRWGQISSLGAANNYGAVSTATSPSAIYTQASTPSAGLLAGTTGFRFWGVVINSTNAGNIQFQWSNNTDTSEDTSVLAGSTLRLVRIL